MSLNDAQIVRDKVAKALHLENSWRLNFHGASKGCIELTFSATKRTWHTEGETQTLKITRNLPQNEPLIFTVQAVTSIVHAIESEENDYVELSSVRPKFPSLRRPRAYTGDDFFQPLTNDRESLDELVLKLYQAKEKWYEIGLVLGIDPKLLDKIRNKCRNIPKNCLKGMLRSWLDTRKATKKVLCAALNDRSVRFHDLSKRIADSQLGTWRVSTL